ncbi:MAG: helicase SNF2, partial [Chitinophagaceae bacterium]
FLQLLNAHGANYFDSIRNMDKEKNKLLQIYGYSLQDDLDGKFEFIYKEGKPFLKLLDSSIKRVAAPAPVTAPAYAYQNAPVVEEAAPAPVVVNGKATRLGIVFNFNAKTYPGFVVDTVQAEADEATGKFLGKTEKLDLTKFVNTAAFTEADKQLFQQVRKLQDVEVNKYLNRNSPFSGIWENIIQTEGDDLPEETKALITEYLHPKLKKVFEEQAGESYAFVLPKGKAFKTAQLTHVELSDDFISPVFKVVANGEHYEMVCMVKVQGELLPFSQNESNSSLLFLSDGMVYLWKKAEDVLQAEKFIQEGNIELSKADWKEKLHKVILPLTREYQVEFDKSLVTEIKDTVPEVKLMLQEKGDYLLFQPVFSYAGFETRLTDKATISIPDGDRILVIHRNTEAEQAFLTKLDTLHTMFVTQVESGSLALRGADVLRNNWFFLFVDAMKEMKVPVFGFEALKNFRFNTARPTTHIHVSSGLDWFDAKVEIEFGKERVGIADIKKALAGKQSFVQLGDGTLGILPDEWLKKYALLFKVGDGRTDKLRLSKYHMSVI